MIESTRFIRPNTLQGIEQETKEKKKKMANISINFILGWCGISVAAQRTRITSDLISAPEGLGNFYNESTEELLSTFQDYGRRDAADGNIIFTRVQQKRPIASMKLALVVPVSKAVSSLSLLLSLTQSFKSISLFCCTQVNMILLSATSLRP